MKMVITDLDGTLLKKNGELSVTNKAVLTQLGKSNIPRVVATGRSIYSAMKLMDTGFPVDYLIFSTGAGIYDWNKRKIIFKSCLNKHVVTDMVALLTANNVSFMLHHEIPDNHRFYFYNGAVRSKDYERRIALYHKYATPFIASKHSNIAATQFISIFSCLEDYQPIRNLMDKETRISCIKTTSPLDGQSIWLEIFPFGVNKSSAAKQLADLLNVRREDILVIGNDWNDEDLLEWGGHSYVVANAPEELKRNFGVVPDNESDGFTEAVRQYLNSFEFR